MIRITSMDGTPVHMRTFRVVERKSDVAERRAGGSGRVAAPPRPVRSGSHRRIHITSEDADRLEGLLHAGLRDSGLDYANFLVLEGELRRAVIVNGDSVSPDVVTMNSVVRISDADGQVLEFTLVFPEDANQAEGRISVVAPLGAAVLGYRAGDTVLFRAPAGDRRLRIDSVLFQPEAAGGANRQDISTE